MDRYIIEGKLGSGAFGAVYRATHKDTGMKVAIKKMRQRYPSWEECLALREIQALCALQNHPSLVKLFAVVRQDERLYLVFEFVGPNLYQAIQDRTHPLAEPKIKSWLRQALQGLAYMHREGYVHRDIKPENLLLRGASTLKIADLGLARTAINDSTYSTKENDNNSVNNAATTTSGGYGNSSGGEKPSLRPWTEYVSTRWYRAPEVLLRSPLYGAPVDIFALGAVAAELYSLKPLFPGTSEPDQLVCIASVLGYPTPKIWPEGVRLANRLGFAFPDENINHHSGEVNDDLLKRNLREVLGPEASENAIDLISKMICWDPEKRLTAEEALQHPYFTSTGVSDSNINGDGNNSRGRVGPAPRESRPRPPLATLQAAAVTVQLLQAAARVGRQPSTTEPTHENNPALQRLAQRAAKRQRATLRRQRKPAVIQPSRKERKEKTHLG